MKKIIYFILLVSFSITNAFASSDAVKLPDPGLNGLVSVETAIQNRRSIRTFQDESIGLKQISQLLWAAGGITIDGMTGPTRAYPSAGGLYPLVLYLVAGKVTDLNAGVYKYSPFSNSLLPVKEGDFRGLLSEAALGQIMVKRAPASIVVVALFNKTSDKYGERGFNRYVSMDAGHLGQNVQLQAYALDLGTCIIGAFNDMQVGKVISIEKGTPVYIIPVGTYEK